MNVVLMEIRLLMVDSMALARGVEVIKVPYTVFVNSCDGFEDCWRPFFFFFRKFWPDCKAEIVLNTESKQWSYPGLALTCTKVQPLNQRVRLTWSECLAFALRKVKTPLVVYFQEDYFLRRPVNVERLDDLAKMMVKNPDIACVGLTEFGSSGPFVPTVDTGIWEVTKESRYRISTQASLWRVEHLQSYLRPRENAWMFEIFGTRRARYRSEVFLTLRCDKSVGYGASVIDYIPTGIIKGKWNPQVLEMITAAGIDVSTKSRGIHAPQPLLIRKFHTFTKIASNPLTMLLSFFGR